MITVWITGPSAVGKTTLANALYKRLKEMGKKVELIDGDEFRRTVYPQLGFSEKEREMHNRVVIELAKRLTRNGVYTIVAIISPFRRIRELARKEIGDFLEVYLKCSLEERIRRDPKGLYKKALKGEIKGLTGLNGVYEEPENPDLVLETDKMSIEEEVGAVLDFLERKNIL